MKRYPITVFFVKNHIEQYWNGEPTQILGTYLHIEVGTYLLIKVGPSEQLFGSRAGNYHQDWVRNLCYKVLVS